MRIMILGHLGMLGNAVHKYLSNTYGEIKTTENKWSTDTHEDFVEDVISFSSHRQDPGYIINCIGWIPQKYTADKISDFKVNYELPIWLDSNLKSKIIHPGTDCEMDDDFYGVSKKIASDYLVNHGVNTKIIKTSIIGHELESADSLLDWFLTTEGTVSGYTKAMWNGNTTLEWAKFCDELMLMWDSQEIENVIQSDCISKYDLLMKMKDIYGGNVTKIRKNNKSMPNKCLTDGIQKNPIEIQLKELKEFYGY